METGMTDPVVGMTQEGEPIRAKDFGYVSYDDVEMKGTFNAPDPVTSPAHYKAGAIECLDVIEELGLDFHLGNVLKYIFRAESKNNYLQDLRKARFYLDRKIGLLEGRE
jgi:hypothetical protein